MDLSATDWTVVNRPAGDLAVTKTVTGDGASEDDQFTFTIKLSGDEALVNQVNGTFGDIDFVGGMAAFTLAAGETKVATNLPAGLSYTVSETVLPGYELTNRTNDTGTIPVRDSVEASFTNNKDAEPIVVPPDDSGSGTTVKPAKRTATPQTGEPWSAALPLAVIGAGLVVVSRRRRLQ